MNHNMGEEIKTRKILKPTVLPYCWASPCSVFGLMASLFFVPFGIRSRIKEGALEIYPQREAVFRWLPFSAITFGHVILGNSASSLDVLRAHEQVHVRQYERWGIFFFVTYPLASLFELFRGRNPYWFNWFEVEARRLSGGTIAAPNNSLKVGVPDEPRS